MPTAYASESVALLEPHAPPPVPGNHAPPADRSPVGGAGRLGNVVELIVAGRRTGRRRIVLLGLLRVDRGWYLGHPNGPVDWTRNLDAAARKNYPTTGKVRINLTKVASTSTAIKVGWFVVEY